MSAEQTFARWRHLPREVAADPSTTRYITERTVDDLRDTLHADAGWPRAELVGPFAPQVNVMLADDRLTGDFVLLAEARALVLTNPNPLPRFHLFRSTR